MVGQQQVSPRSLEKISFHLGFGGTAEAEAPQIWSYNEPTVLRRRAGFILLPALQIQSVLSVSSLNLTCTSKVHVLFLMVQITTCSSAPIPVQ